MKRKPRRVRETFYVGCVNGRIHFYRELSYYDGVRHADLFASEREAMKCYEDVVRVTVERLQRKARGK
jgi:hypothetical protein